jgi:hypothetical protein
MKTLIKIILKLLNDDTLCLLHEECFEEMRKIKFIIYEDDLNRSELN